MLDLVLTTTNVQAEVINPFGKKEFHHGLKQYNSKLNLKDPGACHGNSSLPEEEKANTYIYV